MLKKMKSIFENLKGFVKRGVESYMMNEEIKAKALVEVCSIGADLAKTAGRGLARGIHATIHEIIDGIRNVVNTSTKNKANCLMTACIFGGVVLAYIIKANMVEKNERIIATE